MIEDKFSIRSRHGFYGDIIDKIDQFDTDVMKEIGNSLARVGLLAMKAREVQETSKKWIVARVLPDYI